MPDALACAWPTFHSANVPASSAPFGLHNRHHVHHVVLFVFQNVAVPDVLSSLNAVLGQKSRTRRCRLARRQIELHVHSNRLSGVHPHGFFPAFLVGVRQASAARNYAEWENRTACVRIEFPGFPLSDNNVHQVEVHGVRVAVGAADSASQ